MQNLINRFVCVSVVFLSLVIPASAQDSKVELENNYVRVLRSKLAPLEKRPVHQQADACIVFITNVRERITHADGKTELISGKPGDVRWVPAESFSEESLLSAPSEWAVIEMKDRVHEDRIILDPVKIDPKYHKVVFENNRVRAIRTILEPHVKSPMHEHQSYVVVYITDLHTSMKMADGRELDNPRHAGEIAWRDKLSHVTENIGTKTAEEIQVEMKPAP